MFAAFWAAGVLVMDGLVLRQGIPDETLLGWAVLSSLNAGLFLWVVVGLPHFLRSRRLGRVAQSRELVATPELLMLPLVLLDFITARRLAKAGKPTLELRWSDISAGSVDSSSDEAEHVRFTTRSGSSIKLYLGLSLPDRKRFLDLLEARGLL